MMIRALIVVLTIVQLSACSVGAWQAFEVDSTAENLVSPTTTVSGEDEEFEFSLSDEVFHVERDVPALLVILLLYLPFIL